MKKILIALCCCALSAGAGAAGNVEAGKTLAAKYSCAACHGADFASPVDPSYPKLAGQHRDYLEHALTAYRRGGGPNGRNNPIMTAQVQPLGEQDIKDLAAYLHSLPPSVVVRR